MAFEVSFTRNIKADREFVFDWWTDLSPEDSKLVKPLKSRSVISKTPELILLRSARAHPRKREVLHELRLHSGPNVFHLQLLLLRLIF